MKKSVWTGLAAALLLVAGTQAHAACKDKVELRLSQVEVGKGSYYFYAQVLNKTNAAVNFELSFVSLGGGGRIYNNPTRSFVAAKGSQTLKVGGGSSSGYKGLPVFYDVPAGGGVSVQNCTP